MRRTNANVRRSSVLFIPSCPSRLILNTNECVSEKSDKCDITVVPFDVFTLVFFFYRNKCITVLKGWFSATFRKCRLLSLSGIRENSGENELLRFAPLPFLRESYGNRSRRRRYSPGMTTRFYKRYPSLSFCC